MEKAQLPSPWVPDGYPDYDHAEQLEAIVGSGLTYADLRAEDRHDEGSAAFPTSPRGWAVMGHKWVQIRNSENGEKVLLRLQHSPEGSVTITSVIVPYRGPKPVTGADLRDIPVAALAAAFTAEDMRGKASVLRSIILMADYPLPDPLDPLPEADKSQQFLALVARQYEALESRSRGSVPEAMAELNNRPASTVRRWIAQARKARLLPPAMPTRGE